MDYCLQNTVFKADNDGYLVNLEQWNAELAKLIAKHCDIILQEPHWEIINLLQQYYKEFDHSPAMRPLIKYIKTRLDPAKANSIYLMQLFPGSPAKLAAKIAGLPRPENCL